MLTPINQMSSAFNGKRERLINVALAIFILGWMTQEYSILDLGKYSLLLIYFAAIPFCLWTTSRSLVFMILPLVSTALAAAIGWLQSVGPFSIISQGSLQLLAIFFATGVAAVDWRKHFSPFTKILTAISIPIVIYGGYQMIARAGHLKYAYLPVTNQQEYAIGGLQRGWMKEHFTRASAVFAEPSEFGYLCMWLLILGLCAEKGRWRTLSLGLAFSGMLFSQSLSAALSAVVLILVYLAAGGVNWNVARQIGIAILFIAMAILAIEPLAPEAFNAFSDRIEEAVTLDSRADSGRVDHLPANIKSFMEQPVWGHGLSSITSADDVGADVTTFTYFLMLIERGVVGSILFFAPWLWLTWRAFKLPKSDNFRTVCIMLCMLNLYNFWVSAIVYSLQSWLSLGICASCILHCYLPRSQPGLTGLQFTSWARLPNFQSGRIAGENAINTNKNL